MTITPYLAMTAAEFAHADPLPQKVAWMACHFSPYSTGLSNLPTELPEGSVLIVNDITPIHAHDANVIAQQLTQCVQQLRCSTVLLDLQRAPDDRSRELTAQLLQGLPCPVVVSDILAADFSCPVFLPPCPPYRPLPEHLAPWKGRDIWLDAAREASIISVTRSGAHCDPEIHATHPESGHSDKELHCHYTIELTDQQAKFTLWRDSGDLRALLEEAAELGVCQSIGLYQELSERGKEPASPG